MNEWMNERMNEWMNEWMNEPIHRHLVISLHAKYEVSSFNRSRDIEGVQNFKSRSHDPFPISLDLILHFCFCAPDGQSARQIEVTGSNHFRDMKGSPNSEIMSSDAFPLPFDLILHFFSLVSLMSICMLYMKSLLPTVPVIEGIPKIQKYVT